MTESVSAAPHLTETLPMFQRLDALFSVRYNFMGLCLLGLLLPLFSLAAFGVGRPALGVCAALPGVGIHGYKWINPSVWPTHIASHDFRIAIAPARPERAASGCKMERCKT